MLKKTYYISIDRSSEKYFGILLSIVFLIVALYPLINSESIRVWATIVSAVFFLLAFLLPKVLRFPKKLWSKFGILLTSIIAQIAIVLVYFIVVLPVGLIVRFLGKDFLKQKLDKNKVSYWIDRIKPIGPMKNQF